MNGVQLVSCELGGEAVQEFIHSATCGHKASERLMRASQTNKNKSRGRRTAWHFDGSDIHADQAAQATTRRADELYPQPGLQRVHVPPSSSDENHPCAMVRDVEIYKRRRGRHLYHTHRESEKRESSIPATYQHRPSLARARKRQSTCWQAQELG